MVFLRFNLLFVLFFVLLICLFPVYGEEISNDNCTLEMDCVDGDFDVSCENFTDVVVSEEVLSSVEVSSIECDDFVKVYGNSTNFVARFYDGSGLVLQNTEVFF